MRNQVMHSNHATDLIIEALKQTSLDLNTWSDDILAEVANAALKVVAYNPDAVDEWIEMNPELFT